MRTYLLLNAILFALQRASGFAVGFLAVVGQANYSLTNNC
jgi:hypothetical protein